MMYIGFFVCVFYVCAIYPVVCFSIYIFYISGICCNVVETKTTLGGYTCIYCSEVQNQEPWVRCFLAAVLSVPYLRA